MNRGRHRKKPNNGYPPEVNQLQYPEVFKKCFTPEQTRLLLRRQADAGNPSNLRIFEDDQYAYKWSGGFDWHETKEGKNYWDTMLTTYHHMKYERTKKSYQRSTSKYMGTHTSEKQGFG